ncbi:MAG: cardiolipin synthase [Phycisphaerales bacterium]|jgi:cardiolipin synthase|nr:cardiolipin synthase [Phycisphaerales bacterium]
MTDMHTAEATLVLIAHIGLVIWLVTVLLLRHQGTSDARLAWIVFIVLAPFVGALAYLFLGGSRFAGRRRRIHARVHAECAEGRSALVDLADTHADIPSPYDRIFSLAGALSETDVCGGNALELCGTPEMFPEMLERDVNAAESSVHVLTYIYLDDETGRQVGDALSRAAERGVVVRLMVDSVGSRSFLSSSLRENMESRGVHVVEMLPARLLRLALARLDIRNHRKIAVIDGTVGWVGSRNMASPAFAPKAKYAPWVDCMARVMGPAVFDLEALFIEDWRVNTDQQLTHPLPTPARGDACCQVVGTGPNFNNEALTHVLQACFYAARDDLVLTTPYYVPDAATEAALRGAALRGVKTTLIVPARNDSHLISLASRSHYARLIRAGVEIQEFEAGLLHAKTMTVDHSLFMIGSANLDRRSLELNFEVSLLGWCPDFASQLRFLQMSYVTRSRPVDTSRWLNQRAPSRLVHNLAGLLSPLL